MIQFSVPIEPVAFARSGANGKRRFTPQKQANFMAQIRFFAAAEMQGKAPMEGPLEMTASFIYPRPASWSKTKLLCTFWKQSRPDVDNLAKLVADSLNGCVYVDDAQIASLVIQKRYGERAEVVVTVEELKDGNIRALDS